MHFDSSAQIVPQSDCALNSMYSPVHSALSPTGPVPSAKPAIYVLNEHDEFVVEADPEAQQDSTSSSSAAERTSAELTAFTAPTTSCAVQEFMSFVIRDELERESSPVAQPRRSNVRRSYSASLRMFDELSNFSKVTLGEFERKALHALIKRLRSHTCMLENIRLALTQRSPHTPCVTFPRTRDGRMQIGVRKCRPEEIYVQIFRFPHNVRDDFFSVMECEWNETNSAMVCVNPYHYERYIDAGLAPPSKRRRSGPPPMPLISGPEVAEYNLLQEQKLNPVVQEQAEATQTYQDQYYTYQDEYNTCQDEYNTYQNEHSTMMDMSYPNNIGTEVTEFQNYQYYGEPSQIIENPYELAQYDNPYDAQALMPGPSCDTGSNYFMNYLYEPSVEQEESFDVNWDLVQP